MCSESRELGKVEMSGGFRFCKSASFLHPAPRYPLAGHETVAGEPDMHAYSGIPDCGKRHQLAVVSFLAGLPMAVKIFHGDSLLGLREERK